LTRSEFPAFRVSSGDAFERGRQLGAAAKRQVHGSVAVYEETFAHYTGRSWPQIRALAAEFAAPIAAYDPEILREIEGIAAGASLEVADVLAVNARTEIMFGLGAQPPHECTSFFAGPPATADGHVLVGQNWDWRTRTEDTTILVEVQQGDRPAFLMLAEAGLVGKIGFNAAGIGVAANALVSDLDRGDRAVPFHVVLRGILNARTLEEGVTAVVGARRAASANYLVATAAGHAVNVETGPGGAEAAYVSHPVDGILAHANNFTCATSFGDKSVGDWLDSPVRVERLDTLLRERHGSLTRDAVPELLRDHTCHPNAICRHPDPAQHPVERSSTVASWVIDLTDATATICSGPPCEGRYVELAPGFGATLAS
jgi:isopenicillin-N N-acyltransferase-like protein